MILTFADHEGDPVAVESAAIVGISVGSLNGPKPAEQPEIRVTLVWCAGVSQPFMVAQPFEVVLAAWEAARVAGPPADLKGSHGWPVVWDHPSSVMPGAPAWASKTGRLS